MSGSKGKTPVTRAQHAEPKRERLAPGPAPAPEAAGDAFVDVGFLEDSNALLDKIKGTAENVTTCQVRARLRLRFRLGVRWARRWAVVAHLARTSRAAVARRGTDGRCRTRSRSSSTASGS